MKSLLSTLNTRLQPFLLNNEDSDDLFNSLFIDPSPEHILYLQNEIMSLENEIQTLASTLETYRQYVIYIWIYSVVTTRISEL